VFRTIGDLHWVTLTEAADLIHSGELSPVELTTMMLERIAALDGTLYVYVTVTTDQAMSRATDAAAEIAAGRCRGQLHGIPIAIKDLCDTKGVATGAGTAVRRDDIPDEDSTVVERFEDASGISLGKPTMTEGGYVSRHPSVPDPVNPWNRGRWPGVSPTGSGVATPADLCFASLGSDTGRSIRFPSAVCGVVGIKPTWGRVSPAGSFRWRHRWTTSGP
jgi:amidase